jgi:hypothetical protein
MGRRSERTGLVVGRAGGPVVVVVFLLLRPVVEVRAGAGWSATGGFGSENRQ